MRYQQLHTIDEWHNSIDDTYTSSTYNWMNNTYGQAIEYVEQGSHAKNILLLEFPTTHLKKTYHIRL